MSGQACVESRLMMLISTVYAAIAAERLGLSRTTVAQLLEEFEAGLCSVPDAL